MSSAFQNRLVGTIILVALAVIFLPDLLDGEKVSHKDTFLPVPPRPAQEPVSKTQSFPLDEVRERVSRTVEVVEDVAEDDPVEAATEEAPPVQVATQPAEQVERPAESKPEVVSAGWVVQLGSFRHQKNVKELTDKLEAAGYRTFSRKIKTSAGELTKVFVGPDLQRDKLEKALPHLKELTALQGKITEFRAE
ncbi:SPOR domain-containing protein [Bowmanella yangjiangensis]|uniref:SPOR domain-containing protein n=1 Tax=Bowmanella yangjiangensis TaxID=2811230 RepID=A0ABS3CRP8_9ALTE|nr:SPOR domain-containing protein [Bowmanella yangjiangensis]MBN7818965.1 SPOR domain-containing protein [Bowmanella yangjiangensis]